MVQRLFVTGKREELFWLGVEAGYVLIMNKFRATEKHTPLERFVQNMSND